MGTTFSIVELPLPNLRAGVSKADARKKIRVQLRKGREIRDVTVGVSVTQKDLNAGWAEKSKWIKYTTSLLEQLFDNASFAEEFSIVIAQVSGSGVPSFHEQLRDFQEGMDFFIDGLESIYERLDLVHEAPRQIASRLVIETPRSTAVDKAHGRIYSMTRLDDAEKSRKSAEQRLADNDILGVFQDAQSSVETAVKALLTYLDIGYKNAHDVSELIPTAILKLEKRLEITRFAVVRDDLARAAFWLHVLCSTKDYFYGIKDVGVPAGDVFHPELASFATACVHVTNIVIDRISTLIWQLANP